MDERPADEREGHGPPSGLSTVLLVFAGIDILLAFVMLTGRGFSWHFWAVAAIGIALALAGLKERLT